MKVSDQLYFTPWLKELGKQSPEKAWRNFISANDLPALDLSNAVSAVYSANIEGNPIDVNTLSSVIAGKSCRKLERESTSLNSVRVCWLTAKEKRPCSNCSKHLAAGPDALMRLWTKTTQSKTTSGLGMAAVSDFAYSGFDSGIEFVF